MNEKYLKFFGDEELIIGRMISSSKSMYRKTFPKHKIIFNARIYLLSDYEKHQDKVKDFFKGMSFEIWWGDLDLTLSMEKLERVQVKIGKPIIITTEHGSQREIIDVTKIKD